MQKKYSLGLDLGTRSIGWAITEITLNQNNKPIPTNIIDLGSRIFTKITEDKSDTLKNVKRREERLKRRQIFRTALRKSKLKSFLITHDYLPKEIKNPIKAPEFLNSISKSPYHIRKKALSEPLKKHQLGQALLHFSQRRGYKSNRKTGADKEGEVKKSITSLQNSIKESNKKYYGEYFTDILDTDDHQKIRNHYTSRADYENEFDTIIAFQKQYHPNFLTEKNIKILRDEIIFYHRPLKDQSHLIGKCSLELDEKRSSLANLDAQRFVYLSLLTNLEITHYASFSVRKLSQEEFLILQRNLDKKEKLTWSAVRKLLNLNKSNDIDAINLQNNRNKELKGNKIIPYLEKTIGKEKFEDFDDNKIADLISDLITINDDDKLKNHLLSHWNFTTEIVEKFCTSTVPGLGKYLKYSQKAIKKINPKLEKNTNLHDVINEIYPDQKLEKSKILDLLPAPPEDLRNPVVTKALIELRKVVNSIIKNYGKPEIICIELARDLKNPPKVRLEISKAQNKNEKDIKNISNILKSDFNISSPKYTQILKYRLWKELEEVNGGVCPYTGKKITCKNIFSSEVQIEHIIPQSRSFDNSYNNKTLAFASDNQLKGNKTPWEYCGKNSTEHDKILNRIANNKGKLPKGKIYRFNIGKNMSEDEAQKAIEKLKSQQLKDTQYIAKEARKYLAQIMPSIYQVKAIPSGKITSYLRKQWDNLNDILSVDQDKKEKERTDHRHHAIDAVILSTVTQSTIYKISSAHKNYELNSDNKPKISPPFPDFKKQVRDLIENMTVSHAPYRVVRGILHKETAHGKITKNNKKIFVVRKNILDFSEKQRSAIVDDRIRECVQDFFLLEGMDFNSAMENCPSYMYDALEKHITERQTEINEKEKNRDKIKNSDYKISVPSLVKSGIYPMLENKKKNTYTPIKKARYHESSLSSEKAINIKLPDSNNRFFINKENHHIAIFATVDEKATKKEHKLIQKNAKIKQSDLFAPVNNPKNKVIYKWIAVVVSRFEAHQRIRFKKDIISRTHPTDPNAEFVMSLHKNDMLECTTDNTKQVYRVNDFTENAKGDITINLRLHSSNRSGLTDRIDLLSKTPNTLKDLNPKKISVNPIGKIFPYNS